MSNFIDDFYDESASIIVENKPKEKKKTKYVLVRVEN